jgi:hypothetical protein
MRLSVLGLWIPFLVGLSAFGADLKFKERALAELVKQTPAILASHDVATGRFGSGIWICNDQQQMYPLATVYATPSAANPFHKDAKILEVVMSAGDALIEDMDAEGRWEFRKKDGSTWGPIRMPWTYSRWIRAFELIRDDMPDARRQRWAKALTLGYGRIARSELGHVNNISTHHAMGLYVAGKSLDQPDWQRQAAAFLVKVAGQQAEGGYWSEGTGPVVVYDFVYIDALGTYYAMSNDERVRPALEKAIEFHRHFTYPSGHSVETIDQRNPFHATISPGNVAFTLSASGRTYLQRQWTRLHGTLDTDLAASLVLYGQEGPTAELPPDKPDDLFVLREADKDRAAVIERGPWFLCMSAYTSPIYTSRWLQDRQNFVSVYHEKTGLVFGGGNTKLQSGWSSFSVGDQAALAHRPGEKNPNFLPKGTLYHVPTAAALAVGNEPNLELTYGPETCRIRVCVKDDRTLEYVVSSSVASGLPIHAHLTLLPRMGKLLETCAGKKITLEAAPLALTAEHLGAWITLDGYRLRLPPGAELRWPVLPHNPYRDDGRAEPDEGRLVIAIPLDRPQQESRIVLEIL